jgi:hypothetical protein
VGGLRSNVLNVLRQLSRHGANDIEAVNLVSLRNSQPNETESANELSSNLFYYLFDDWLSTMMVLHGFQQRMKKLVSGLAKIESEWSSLTGIRERS